MKNYLLILLGCIIFFIFLYQQNEEFTNICNGLNQMKKDDIIKQNLKFIQTNMLEPYLNILLKPIENTISVDNKITLESYLIDNKIPKEQINNSIKFLKKVLTDNYIISSVNEYDINEKTLLRDIIHTWYFDNLRNSMNCLISDKKILDMILQQIFVLINTPMVEICSKEKFIEYCEKSYSLQNKLNNETQIKKEIINKKEIEKFVGELDKTKKEINTETKNISILEIESKILPLVSNNSKFMDAKAIDEIINSFNEKSFGLDVEKELKQLLNSYQIKYGKKINMLNKNEFGNLVLILIDNLKLIIQELINEDDVKKLKIIINDFNANKKIFYMLKHNYKIVQAYEIINQEIKDNDERLKALLCCSKKDEKSCHNFSNIAKNPSSIIFGFNKLGYVNSIKCIKDSSESKEMINEQNKTIDEILSSKYEMWKKISIENKKIIMENLNKLLAVNGLKIINIDDKLSNIRLQLSNQNKLNPSELLKTLLIKPSNIDLNICTIRTHFLNKLRRDRVISLEEYKDYDNKINLYCNPK